MTPSRFGRLEEVILDALFPDVDLALRRGRHVTADELAFYTFLSDAREHLETFYRRYGCELMHKSDGFFYLLPSGDKLGKRHLRPVEMLVGQALALLYLDPRTVEAGGTIVRDDVLGQLASVLGSDDLVRALYPGKKRVDERVAQEGVRSKVSDAIRKLGALGFVSTTEEGRIRLSPALLRFAEPARLGEPPDVILARLAAEGELMITEGLEDDGFDDESDDRDDTDDLASTPPTASEGTRDDATSDDASAPHGAPSGADVREHARDAASPSPTAVPAPAAPPLDVIPLAPRDMEDDGDERVLPVPVAPLATAPTASTRDPARATSPSEPPAIAHEDGQIPLDSLANEDADDEPLFEPPGSSPDTSADASLDESADNEPYEPAGLAIDDGPYELEGPFGDEAADDELPYELDASDAVTSPAEVTERLTPREPGDDAPPSSRG